jgi:hypothetical protein
MTNNDATSSQSVQSPVKRARWQWLLLALPLLAVTTFFSVAYAHGFGRGGPGEMGGFMQGHMFRMLGGSK